MNRGKYEGIEMFLSEEVFPLARLRERVRVRGVLARRPHPSLLPEGEGEEGSRGNEMTRHMHHLESNGMNL